MGLFNRYDGPYTGLESSYWEGNEKYCNPKDYSVSEDECRQYLEDLEKGKKLNDEWNRERISRLIKTSYSIGFILTFSILFLVWYWLYKTDSAWAYPIALVTSWGVLGLSVWFFNKVSDYFHNQRKFFVDRFYPRVNENIERLFDDYLWKCKLLDDARKKGEEEWKLTHKKVERMSHPDLDLFIETIEEELKNPSEKYVFGDVIFGMNLEEIYNTKVFKGLILEDSKYIHLGYRGYYLGRFFGIQSSRISFHLESDRLANVTISSTGLEVEEIIEHFISCCEKLNQYYGNPTNLCKRLYDRGYELFSNNQAEFRVGGKSIILKIVKEPAYSSSDYNIELTFSTTTENCHSAGIPQQPFDKSWFDGLRKIYSTDNGFSGSYDRELGQIDDWYSYL